MPSASADGESSGPTSTPSSPQQFLAAQGAAAEKNTLRTRAESACRRLREISAHTLTYLLPPNSKSQQVACLNKKLSPSEEVRTHGTTQAGCSKRIKGKVFPPIAVSGINCGPRIEEVGDQDIRRDLLGTLQAGERGVGQHGIVVHDRTQR